MVRTTVRSVRYAIEVKFSENNENPALLKAETAWKIPE